jgi:hypothetical protein
MVTAAIVPALRPAPPAGADVRVGARTARVRPLPVPVLSGRPSPGTRYGLAVLDRYGRVADRALLRALGWEPGHTLELTLIGGSILTVPRPGGPVRVGHDGYLRLPIGLRRACDLAAGDRVLLVAEPSIHRLLLHPPAALDALLGDHHTALLQDVKR